MIQGQERMSLKVSGTLVRIWFGMVSCTAFFLAALLVVDLWRGEVIEHIGWQFPLSLAALLCAGVAILSLPLLIVAVILDRKKKCPGALVGPSARS